MNRFRNYGLWLSMFMLFAMVAKSLGWHLPNDYDQIVTAVLAILVMAGIISDPTSGKWYKDSKEDNKE